MQWLGHLVHMDDGHFGELGQGTRSTFVTVLQGRLQKGPKGFENRPEELGGSAGRLWNRNDCHGDQSCMMDLPSTRKRFAADHSQEAKKKDTVHHIRWSSKEHICTQCRRYYFIYFSDLYFLLVFWEWSLFGILAISYYHSQIRLTSHTRRYTRAQAP
jgi:formate-dependent nitrite reductase cytochrome c552 subunit